jgi:four helix bundle protein
MIRYVVSSSRSWSSNMTDEYRFPHEYLDVYRLALELSNLACTLADTIPRGRRKLADHLVRAGTSIPLLIAEGANRVSHADKAHKFTEARSETAECGAASEVALTQKIGDQTLAREVLSLARRVGAMLTGLVGKYNDEDWARKRCRGDRSGARARNHTPDREP